MVILLSLLFACSGNHIGTDAATQVDTLRNLAEDHADSVSAISDLSEIAALETSYTTDWDADLGTLSDLKDDMITCMGLDSDLMGSDTDTTWLSDLEGHIDDVDAQHASHSDDMEACDDVGSCLDNEEENLAEVNVHLDGMTTNLASWDPKLKCDK